MVNSAIYRELEKAKKYHLAVTLLIEGRRVGFFAISSLSEKVRDNWLFFREGGIETRNVTGRQIAHLIRNIERFGMVAYVVAEV